MARRCVLAGRGQPGQQGGPAGDVLVEIHIEPHPRFEREGDDLVTRATISQPQAALGGEIEVADTRRPRDDDDSAGHAAGPPLPPAWQGHEGHEVG